MNPHSTNFDEHNQLKNAFLGLLQKRTGPRLFCHVKYLDDTIFLRQFAVVGSDVYLLQARPITALDAWTDKELRREFDTAVLTDEDYVTQANTGEVGRTQIGLRLMLVGFQFDLELEFEPSRVTVSPVSFFGSNKGLDQNLVFR